VARYELIFNGELAAGTDRAACIRELAGALGKDPAEVEHNLFQDWPRIVLRSDDPEKVDQVVRVFAGAGARLEVHDAQAGPSRRRWRRAAVAAAAAGLLLLGLAGAAAWYTMPLWHGSDHPELAATEAALATPDLAVLAHFDVRRAVDIERRFLGEADSGALPGARSDFVGRLLASEIQPRESLDLAVLGGYAAGQDMWASAVLLGRFEPDAVRRFIEQHYQPAAAPPGGGGDAIYFTRLDEQTCQRSPLLAASVSPGRIVVARGDRLRPLLERLAAGAGAAVPLETWREFRAARVASLGALAPAELTAASAGGASPGMARAMLSRARPELDGIDAAYLGFDAAALPPGVALTGAISSGDASLLDARQQDLEQALASARGRFRSQAEITALFEHIETFRDRNQLGARLRMDRDFGEDLQNLARAGLTAMFAAGGIEMDTGNGAPAGEQVVASPAVFRERLDPASLPAFSEVGDGSFQPAWSEGPVGLRIAEVGAAAEQPGRIYLKLEAQARNLANVGDNGQWGRLTVDEVLDPDGRPVMPRPECGRNRNQDPAFLTSAGQGTYFQDGEVRKHTKHQAEKKLVLAPGAGPADIARIEGTIELDLPVAVRRETLDTPLAGRSVEAAGARVAFAPADGGTLHYDTSGELDRILAVRALNDQGQVLQTAGATTMSRLLGHGKVHQRDFQGTPAAVEVIVATELASRRYDFTLERAYPPLSGAAHQRPLPRAVSRAEVEAAFETALPEAADDFSAPRAVADAGPTRIAATNVRSGGFFGLQASLNLRTAVIPGLADNLAAGQIKLTGATGAGGARQPLNLAGHFGLAREGMFVNGAFQPSEDKPYLQGRVNLSERDLDGGVPSALDGRLTLALPLAISRETIPALTFGRTHRLDDVVVTPVSLRPGTLRLHLEAGRGRLAAAEALDAGGEPVHGPVQIHRAGERSGWHLDVGLGALPHSLVLHLIGDAMTRAYPFSLNLDE